MISAENFKVQEYCLIFLIEIRYYSNRIDDNFEGFKHLKLANAYNHLHEIKAMPLQDPDKLIKVVLRKTFYIHFVIKQTLFMIVPKLFNKLSQDTSSYFIESKCTYEL